MLTIDTDPSATITNFFADDPINVTPADHSFGNNLTPNGDGTEAGNPFDYNLLRVSNNVVQNSSNLGFFTDSPNADGIYTFTLAGSDSTGVLASTSINVVVKTSTSLVPLPTELPLMLIGLAAMAAIRYQPRIVL